MFENMAKLQSFKIKPQMSVSAIARFRNKQVSLIVDILRRTVLLVMILVFASCARQEKEPGESETAALYEKAEAFAVSHEYEKALELLREGLAADTLNGFSPMTARALNRKSMIEGVTGNYFDALASHETIEKRCRGMLPAAAEAERIRSKAALLVELGEFAGAEKAMTAIASLSVPDSLELARYQVLAGEREKALDMYSNLSGSSDPVFALMAFTGLLELSLDASLRMAEAPSFYVHRITGIARKLVTRGKEGDEKAEALALRRAAMFLELFPAHAKDASYLYFKALSRARAAGEEKLVQMLDVESNAVLKNEPEVYARTLDYFERNNMSFERMAALLKQGAGEKMDDDSRIIKVLKQGLNIYRYHVPPRPGYTLRGLVDRSAEMLTELLLNKGRFAEAFESDELKKLFALTHLVQRGYVSFELPDEHEQLERQVVKLGREMNALHQRLMNMYESGRGYENHEAVIEAINRKRGIFHQKLAEVQRVSPFLAERLTVNPVTLGTVQEALDKEHAILKIIDGREWCTVFLVQDSYVDVSRRKVDGAMYRSRLKLFREHIATNAEGVRTRIARDSERLWLTDLLIKPYAGRLRDISRLTVIAGEPVPAHLLGNNRFLIRDFPVSWVYSANEFIRQASQRKLTIPEPEYSFYSAERYKDALERKLLFPRHTVFLLWRHFSASEIDELRVLFSLLLQQGGDLSGALHQMAQDKQVENDRWIYLTEY